MPRVKLCDWRVTCAYRDNPTETFTWDCRATGMESAMGSADSALNYECWTTSINLRAVARPVDVVLVERIRP